MFGFFFGFFERFPANLYGPRTNQKLLVPNLLTEKFELWGRRFVSRDQGNPILSNIPSGSVNV